MIIDIKKKGYTNMPYEFLCRLEDDIRIRQGDKVLDNKVLDNTDNLNITENDTCIAENTTYFLANDSEGGKYISNLLEPANLVDVTHMTREQILKEFF
jgi:hypothetical protein